MKDGEPSVSEKEVAENTGTQHVVSEASGSESGSETKQLWSGHLTHDGVLAQSWAPMHSIAFKPEFVFHLFPSGRRYFKKTASLLNSRTMNKDIEHRISSILPSGQDSRKTELWWKKVAALSFVFFACRNKKEIPKSTSQAAWFSGQIATKMNKLCAQRYGPVPIDAYALDHVFKSLVPLFDPHKALIESFVYHPEFVHLQPRATLASFPSPCPRSERASLALTCKDGEVFLYNPHPFKIDPGSTLTLGSLAVSSPFNASTKWSGKQEGLASEALSEISEDELNLQANLLFFLSKNVYLKEAFALPGPKKLDTQTSAALSEFFWSRTGLITLRTLIHEELEEKDKLSDEFAVDIYLWVSFYDFIALLILRNKGNVSFLRTEEKESIKVLCDVFIELLSLLFPQGEGVLPFLLHKGIMSRWVKLVDMLLPKKSPSAYTYSKFLNERKNLLLVHGGVCV